MVWLAMPGIKEKEQPKCLAMLMDLHAQEPNFCGSCFPWDTQSINEAKSLFTKRLPKPKELVRVKPASKARILVSMVNSSLENLR